MFIEFRTFSLLRVFRSLLRGSLFSTFRPEGPWRRDKGSRYLWLRATSYILDIDRLTSGSKPSHSALTSDL